MKPLVDLSQQRCFHHAQREAAARCPECQRFYCRECITEHEERVLCANCLKKVLHPPLKERPWFVATLNTMQLIFGLSVLWMLFYLLGATLLSIDSSVHEGTVWKEKWLDLE